MAKHIDWTMNRWRNNEGNRDLEEFNVQNIKEITEFQKTNPLYSVTSLKDLGNLANHLKLSEIKIKDESSRFGLNAFKVMGGIVGIGKYLAKRLNKDFTDLSFADLQSDETKKALGDVTFIAATDGNHGRGLAWAAKQLGQKSVVYMPKGSSMERLEAIKNEGAYAEITDMNYNDTVRMSENIAKEKGWVLIQDTAWEGYEEIPHWITQGYGTIAYEIIEELENNEQQSPTHIFLQVGCGSFAVGISSYFLNYYKDNPPNIILIETDAAGCYFNSFKSETGAMETVGGDLSTIMAGLSCGEPSTIAYDILRDHALATFVCDNSIAALGMRILGNPIGNDSRIVSGESGAAVPLGLLFHLLAKENTTIQEKLLLDENSRILLINTESDTDKESYLDIMWKGHYPYE